MQLSKYRMRDLTEKESCEQFVVVGDVTLLSTFGGDDIPACGFGFGDAVIIELLKERQLLPELDLQVENIICSLDQDLQGAASAVAAKLREKGQSVDLVLESKPLKWHMILH